MTIPFKTEMNVITKRFKSAPQSWNTWARKHSKVLMAVFSVEKNEILEPSLGSLNNSGHCLWSQSPNGTWVPVSIETAFMYRRVCVSGRPSCQQALGVNTEGWNHAFATDTFQLWNSLFQSVSPSAGYWPSGYRIEPNYLVFLRNIFW